MWTDDRFYGPRHWRATVTRRGRLTPDANALGVIPASSPGCLPIPQFPLLHAGTLPGNQRVGDAVGRGGLAGV